MSTAVPSCSPLRSSIEAILLVSDSPVSVRAIADSLQVTEEDVTSVCQEIADEFVARRSGMDLRYAEGGWRLYTSKDQADNVEAFLLHGSRTRLSRAALETLAVVAYRQPVTRAQIAAVRGVNVDGVVRTLVLRGLLQEVEPDVTTGAHRYETTPLFLELLGIESLDDLLPLAPLLPDVESIDEDF